MRLTLFLLLLVYNLPSTAQQKLFEKYIGWNGNFLSVKTFQNGSATCVLVLRADSIKAFLLTKDNNCNEIFTVPRSVKENFLGGFIKNNKVYLFMDNGINEGIRCWLYDEKDKKVTENPIPFAIKNSRIINRLSSDNYFFYFTYNKKAAAFTFYRFADEKKCDTLKYADDSGLWETVTTQRFFFRDIDIERADVTGECPIETAQARNKIYVRKDTLVLIVNGSASSTSIYGFDIAGGGQTFRSVRHATGHNYPAPEVSNSFLLQDELYFCSASKRGLNLQILDFYTGKKINEYYVQDGKDIDFINTNIGEGKLTNDVAAAKGRTGKLLKQMAKGNVVIITQPLPQEKSVVLTIGSFREMQSAPGMMMGPGGSMTMVSPGFSWTQSSRFKSMLRSKTFEHIPGAIPLLIDERTSEYIKEIKVVENARQLFLHQDKYCFVYYQKRERILNVVQF